MNALSVAKVIQADLVRHCFLGKPLEQFCFLPGTFVGDIFAVQNIQFLVQPIRFNLPLLLSLSA
jgi:hypothetical protein